MKRHIVIIQGHPDGGTRHLGHALVDACERGALGALTRLRPVRTSMIGNVEGGKPARRTRWVARVQSLGAAAR